MLKKITTYLIIGTLIFACNSKKNAKSYDFETGQFISYLADKKDSSSFYRVDNFQIETYRNSKDTFAIKWKNKFEFHLKKINPKTKLDSTNFIVRITKIKNNAYDFEAGYENSNFKQKGSTFKIN